MTTALRDAIDHTALGWVKPEIDETLRQARLEIEAFVENPGDAASMRSCRSNRAKLVCSVRKRHINLPAPSLLHNLPAAALLEAKQLTAANHFLMRRQRQNFLSRHNPPHHTLAS